MATQEKPAPLCSFLLPSRTRFDRLEKAVDSIQENSSDSEILIRLDDCDPGAEDFANKHPELKVVIGPRECGGLVGYGALHLMYDELAKLSEAQWLWMWNDDCFLQVDEGRNWEDQIREFPTSGVLVHPQYHRIGPSLYEWDSGSAFPCVTREFWFSCGATDPMDTHLVQVGKERRWETRFLQGVGASHQRDRDEILAVHRKI